MRTRAVLLDALGTLVFFGPPAPRLAAALGVDEDAARRAMRAEIAHYRAHLGRASDLEGLRALRRDCAQVVEDELRTGRPLEEVLDALLAAIRFEPYPEVPGVLAELRERGLALVVCSNWDVSLREVLRATGLARLVDGVVVSAEEGVAKPDPQLFARALALAGVPAEAAVHVGDTYGEDVAGALAAGVRPVFLARQDEPEPDGIATLRDLSGLPALLD